MTTVKSKARSIRTVVLPAAFAFAAAGVGIWVSHDKGQENRAMFATEELAVAYRIKPPDVQTVAASDGVQLAVYPFRADAPVTSLVFYHGGGAHSLAGYQKLADGLSRHYRISTYLVDIRGHGASGGERGDAPDPEQVWRDIAAVIDAIKAQAPNLPLLLGAHSSGAGLVLNYLDSTAADSARDSIAGIVFIAPEFGYRADTQRAAGAGFAKVSYLPFVVNRLSGGRVCGHCQAVHFNYAPETIAKSGVLPGYTVNLSRAVTPADPLPALGRLKPRLAIWAAENDELLDPAKLKNFVSSARVADAAIEFNAVPRAKHLSILVQVDSLVGKWILETPPQAKPRTPSR